MNPPGTFTNNPAPKPVSAAPATPMPWWQILIHIFAVAAPVAATFVTIWNHNPQTDAAATATGNLAGGIAQGLETL